MTLNIWRLLRHKDPTILEVGGGRVNVHATERYESGLMAVSPSLHSNNLSQIFKTHSGLDGN